MTDSGDGSTTSRVGDRQPHSPATPDGEPRPEADLDARPVTEPAVEVAKPAPWYARLARALPRAIPWIATIVIGSLLVPAITKQWSDRARELEIKTALVREISELTTDTVTAPVLEVFGATPTARLAEYRKNLLNKASKADKAKALKQYEAAVDANVKEAQADYAKKYATWRNKGTAIRAQLSAYFSGAQLTNDWDALYYAVASFTRLSTNACDRSDDIKNVRSFFASEPFNKDIQWPLLEKARGVDAACYIGDRDLQAFRVTYSYVGDRIILQQQHILDSIMKADMVGFSNGWNDLVKDVVSSGP
jgi:hypothetical protein